MLENRKKFGLAGMELYSNSKLANVLFAYELAQRTKGTGIATYSLCPGMVRTNITKNSSKFERLLLKIQAFLIGFPVEQVCFQDILYHMHDFYVEIK